MPQRPVPSANLALFLLPPMLASCGDARPGAHPERSEPVEEARLEGEPIDTTLIPAAALARARQAADDLSHDLAGMVLSTLEEQGPAAAVRICSEVAQERTARHSGKGIEVRRISDRLRNPRNAPDPAEARELERLQERHAAGELPSEVVRLVHHGAERELHYLRPIRIQPPCLACHGDPAAIAPEVRQILTERYPDDRAVGYQAGDLRGAVSVRVLLDDSP